LFGFEAIIAHNGWGISLVGISIVFTGLILLALAVAQIHKIIELWDKRHRFKKPRQKKEKKEATVPDLTVSQDVQRASRQFKLLIEWIGEPFPLPKLLDLSEKCGLSRPHSTINELVKCELIIPDGNGYFIWNKEKFRDLGKKE